MKPDFVDRAAAAAREISRTSEQTPPEVSDPDTSDATDPRSSNGTSQPPATSDGSAETHAPATSNAVKQEQDSTSQDRRRIDDAPDGDDAAAHTARREARQRAFDQREQLLLQQYTLKERELRLKRDIEERRIAAERDLACARLKLEAQMEDFMDETGVMIAPERPDGTAPNVSPPRSPKPASKVQIAVNTDVSDQDKNVTVATARDTRVTHARRIDDDNADTNVGSKSVPTGLVLLQRQSRRRPRKRQKAQSQRERHYADC